MVCWAYSVPYLYDAGSVLRSCLVGGIIGNVHVCNGLSWNHESHYHLVKIDVRGIGGYFGINAHLEKSSSEP